MKKNIRIGDILIEDELITEEQLQRALELQKTQYVNKRIGDVLIELNYVSEERFMHALSKRLKVPFINLKNYPIKNEVVNLLDETIARKYILVPIASNKNTLTVAMSDPLNLYAIEEVKISTKMEVTTILATKEDIQTIIDRYYSGRQAMLAAAELQREFKAREDREALQAQTIDLGNGVDNAPIVRMVNSIVYQAVKLGASDIHIEGGSNTTRVRMRIDGQLQQQMNINSAAHDALTTRIKIIANMNIAEKRVPQDGRFEVRIEDHIIDIRVSSIPTTYGEKMVLRILNTEDDRIISVEELGLTSHNRRLFEKMIKSPNGIILVTGPTGSGKSTTLYAILNTLNKPTDNIITLEDPIEKKMSGINQVQINEKAGLTFASGLRSILRQDPDVIMVGEIRDKETASIAIRSAITGHLVFSTLHTNDAVTTITRLVDMGVEPYLVASSVVGVVAQRLARLICPHCRETYLSTEEENELLGLEGSVELARGKGCQMCSFTGYKGRTGIHEIILITSELRQMISHGIGLEEIRQYCREAGTVFLRDNMRTLILGGKTTVDEYVKMTYSID